ncbi:hypothetical protein BJ508DRAFT_364584 [Ascobolus immersus RN42]|uniref:Uncharacterized protein n=1 Tax=Ascobolus immersus RN42 TaxID=1160509 RepID=A0A3N4HW07_ASCIM|nr:hypothetical protein BJ508DRAFT_364584 [Ascobolus immersus RN42]
MASPISDIAFVFKACKKARKYLKTAPVKFEDTSRALLDLAKILKVIHELSKPQKRSPTSESSLKELNPQAYSDAQFDTTFQSLDSDTDEEDDDRISFEGSIGNAFRHHISMCKQLLLEFHARSTRWRESQSSDMDSDLGSRCSTRKSAVTGLFTPFITTKKTLDACSSFTPKEMQKFETQVRNQIQALEVLLAASTAKDQRKIKEQMEDIAKGFGGIQKTVETAVEDGMRKVQTNISLNFQAMYQMMKVLRMEAKPAPGAEVPNSEWGPVDVMRVSEPFGVLKSVPVGIFRDLEDVCGLFCMGLRDYPIMRRAFCQTVQGIIRDDVYNVAGTEGGVKSVLPMLTPRPGLTMEVKVTFSIPESLFSDPSHPASDDGLQCAAFRYHKGNKFLSWYVTTDFTFLDRDGALIIYLTSLAQFATDFRYEGPCCGMTKEGCHDFICVLKELGRVAERDPGGWVNMENPVHDSGFEDPALVEFIKAPEKIAANQERLDELFDYDCGIVGGYNTTFLGGKCWGGILDLVALFCEMVEDESEHESSDTEPIRSAS